MTFEQSFMPILVIATSMCLYGMLNKKDWFWEPEKNLDSFFAWQSLWNIPFRYLFGKWGVIVFNIVILSVLWGGVLYFILQGK